MHSAVLCSGDAESLQGNGFEALPAPPSTVDDRHMATRALNARRVTAVRELRASAARSDERRAWLADPDLRPYVAMIRHRDPTLDDAEIVRCALLWRRLNADEFESSLPMTTQGGNT